ncbi:MAG TPA: MarR family transcriptional regulator [Acidimicrobiales bacterium]|nr:MarR family transcriptional regulator [Acidimicrobiales bacterium]
MGERLGAADDISLPTLLAMAAQTYGQAIQAALAEAGYGDVPRTGYRIVGTLTRGGLSVQELARRHGVSKQAIGRLVEVLVVRGYVARQDDPSDRRRVILQLTDRGREATEAGRGAIAKIDAALGRATSQADLAAARRTLRALAAVGSDGRGGTPA